MNGWHRVQIDNETIWTIHRPPADVQLGRLHEHLALDDDQHRDLDAYHEAAHAMVAVDAGIPVHTVEIRPGQHPSGWMTYGSWTGPWVDLATMCAAGEQGALRWLREIGRYTETGGWAAEVAAYSDRAAAEAMCSEPVSVITDDPTTRHDWRHLGALAQQRLAVLWPAVHDLAATLIAHGTAGPDDLPALRHHQGLP
ncbi:hypothetical protein FDG2_0430 [Candidatus Protofrankia californiensis]|uniref:Peptidase M41 domain-containing protein n=1 Tax=Candidatus Protofrankia californiensis TaxID=1839754 RepID=A0A1C3NTI1_9ACTN|nr:hypothetical protein FDG2_0430 [Candidatus Protofrankia californiensis]